MSGLGRGIPPLKAHVVIYFMQKGLTENDADFFFHQQNLTGWKTPNGLHPVNWKTLACDWIWELLQARKNRQRQHFR
jgi:hypothetical protein